MFELLGGRKGERTSSGHVKKHPIQLGKESNQFVSLLFLVRGTETCLQTEKELTERQKKALNFHVVTTRTSNDPTMDSGLGWPLEIHK